ncbi:hypothetical protein [Pseudomonas helleri]|uniref:hypothetical protein n=1 Tax=Pseudomonas helleri TaxID=1608996 RepID=UPI001885B2CC|nr:hypothetical protein [Pseudomonas helleri]
MNSIPEDNRDAVRPMTHCIAHESNLRDQLQAQMGRKSQMSVWRKDWIKKSGGCGLDQE